VRIETIKAGILKKKIVIEKVQLATHSGCQFSVLECQQQGVVSHRQKIKGGTVRPKTSLSWFSSWIIVSYSKELQAPASTN
jgi:hypothetical protein